LEIGFPDMAMNDQGHDDLSGLDGRPLRAILHLALELGQRETSPYA
jgi:hypothetical protein